MFYFYADKSGSLEKSQKKYLLKAKRTFSDLGCAREKEHERILVLDTEAMPVHRSKHGFRKARPAFPFEKKKNWQPSGDAILDLDGQKDFFVPTSAIRNLKPYLEPFEIEAGGGIITRKHKGRLEVLLIHRRGVWDLPKGKLDTEETIAECALREVKEEVGTSNIHLVRALDLTVHGYPERKKFRIKTTHWYQMKTNATSFVPEKKEGIVKVRWFPWKTARKKLAYITLRELLVRVRPLISE